MTTMPEDTLPRLNLTSTSTGDGSLFNNDIDAFGTVVARVSMSSLDVFGDAIA